jgi:chromate transporter
MAIKIVLPLRRRPVAIAIAAVCFLAIAIFNLPLLPTMLLLSPVSVLATWRLEA